MTETIEKLSAAERLRECLHPCDVTDECADLIDELSAALGDLIDKCDAVQAEREDLRLFFGLGVARARAILAKARGETPR